MTQKSAKGNNNQKGGSENYGLTPDQRATQKMQLLAFVRGDKERIYDLGQEGLGLLASIAQDISSRLPKDVANNAAKFQALKSRPYWCGYVRAKTCLDKSITDGKCAWIPGKGCFDAKACNGLRKRECLAKAGEICAWKLGRCVMQY